MGYLAPVKAVDVSNSNTPLAVDPTDPVTDTAYRVVIQVGRDGHFHFTKTNAYSGNNGRAAVLLNTDGLHSYLTVGNAGNGSNPQPDGVVLGAGAQIMDAEHKREIEADAGRPDTGRELQRHAARREGRQDRQGRQLPRPDGLQQRRLHDEGKRRQWREHRVLHRHVRRLRAPRASAFRTRVRTFRPRPLAYDSTKLQTTGLPSNMCILSGFPSTLNSALKTKTHRVSVRNLVRQRDDAVRRRRRRRQRR